MTPFSCYFGGCVGTKAGIVTWLLKEAIVSWVLKLAQKLRLTWVFFSPHRFRRVRNERRTPRIYLRNKEAKIHCSTVLDNSALLGWCDWSHWVRREIKWRRFLIELQLRRLCWEPPHHQLKESMQNANKLPFSPCVVHKSALQRSRDLKRHREEKPLLSVYTIHLFPVRQLDACVPFKPHRRAPVPATRLLAPSVDKT